MVTPPPTLKIDVATIRVQKYRSLPCPKGWPSSAGRWLRFVPRSISPPLAVSTSEWMPSAIMEALPVKAAATNLVIMTARLAAIPATTEMGFEEAMPGSLPSRLRYLVLGTCHLPETGLAALD